MGWTGYPGKTPDEALAAHLSDVKALARKDVGDGRNFWILAERNDGQGALIVLVIRDGDALKDVDESMGPLRYDCPREWLDAAPATGGFGTNWRKRVLARYAVERTRVDVGPDVFGPGGFSPVDLLLDQDIADTVEEAREIVADLYPGGLR